MSFPFIVFYDSKKHEMVFWMNNEIYEKETKIIKHFAPYVTKKVLRRNKGLKKNEQENSNNQAVINDVKKNEERNAEKNVEKEKKKKKTSLKSKKRKKSQKIRKKLSIRIMWCLQLSAKKINWQF